MRGWLALGLCLLGPVAAQAEPLRLAVYPEGVRFDLRSGRFLVPPPGGGSPDPVRYELPSQPLRLRAVRDEVVAFQVVVTGPAGEHPVVVRAPRGPDEGPSPLEMTVFNERGIEVDRPSESPFIHGLGIGRYPDPLVPTATVAVPYAEGLAVLWVDVWVPPEAPTGLHRLALEVGPTRLEAELEVLSPVLPETDVARLGAVNFGSFLGRLRQGTLLPWQQLAHAHLLSVEVMRPVPEIKEGVIDWAAWAELLAPYADGTAFGAAAGYRGPRAGQPIGRAVIPLTDWWPVPATAAGTPSDPVAWSKALAAWEQTVIARGWFDLKNSTDWLLFINSLDEPKSVEKLQALAAYGPWIEAAQLQHRDRVLFRVDGNFGQPIPGFDAAAQAELLGPVVDLWNAHGAPYTFPYALLEHRRSQRGERVMYYASNSGGEPAIPPLVVDAPLTGARAWGWIVRRYHLDGALNWEVDSRAGCVEDPLCSPGRAMNLDATLIYRGHEVGAAFDRPVPSMRLKALRRGAQDAQLLALLEAQDPEAAAALLELMIPRALGDRVPETGVGAWSRDPGDWERARRAILDRLEGSDRPLAIQAVRQDPGPRWLEVERLWPLAAGAGLAILALPIGWWWRRRRART